jgi:hypothetical protein
VVVALVLPQVLAAVYFSTVHQVQWGSLFPLVQPPV